MLIGSLGHPLSRSKVPQLEEVPVGAVAMIHSLCETCAWRREVVTPKRSRFLLCQLSQTNPAYPKYPLQPIVRCDGYQQKQQTKER
jgi:hypothetical protein